MIGYPGTVVRGVVCRILVAVAAAVLGCRLASAEDGASVKAWEEPMVIPTYQVGPADPNPIFYTRESYQGAQKRVYPYPLQDNLTHLREDRTYTALNVENQYLKFTVLPEIGGRLFAATDKTNHYDFFYRQHVIKPALIGMLGAWVSGGVEWCAFHHHRSTTFMPVDYTLTDEPDGGRTVWFGEIERRHRMKWLVGLTLRPGRSYIEATVKLFNRTGQPHSILYWANAAVHVNPDYQVIFPPSVQVATHHAKIDFTCWPISQGRYLGTDYTGQDLSWWKNSAGGNSFFAWDLQEDFMGGYDHGRQAGVVHVGDHHLVCGAKLWEWGSGPSGRLWDSILTDTDGPYAELMTGAWSDNQPDYSWIKPYEVKVIKQYWYPVRDIGGFKNANLNGAVNLELKSDSLAAFGFNTTSEQSNARAVLAVGGQTVFEQTIEIGPERPFMKVVTVPAGTRETDLRVSLVSADGQELVAYQPVERKPVTQLPAPVKAPPRPQDIQGLEELYLTGLRIEQIHNPSVDPSDYYQEALKRDPGDSRCNTILGVHANQRGLYEQAEKYSRKAIERISADYTRPANTEAYYELGLALRGQGRDDQAHDSLYRASWDQAFHAAAFHQLAELSCKKRAYTQALDQIDRSLSTNALNTKARGVKAMILRKMNRPQEAEALAHEILADDPLDFLAGNELYLAELAVAGVCDQRASDARSETQPSASKALADLNRMMRGEVQSYLELTVDYLNCGQWDEAIGVLQRPVEANTLFTATYPLVHYYLGYLHERKGNADQARACYARAARMPSDYCFPFRLETADVLNAAIRAQPDDARAYYYLGNLLFELQPDRAIACWEKSRALDDQFALVHRNLGWASYRARNDVPRAIDCYEQAVARNRLDPRLYFELDSLYEIGNVAPERRLALLDTNHDVVRRHQDSLLREIMVLILVGRYDQAIDYLANNRFHAREGAERIGDVYVDAHLLRGLEYLKAGQPAEALNHFRRAGEYPDNLALGRRTNSLRAPQVAYYTGMAYEAMGDAAKARECFSQIAERQGTPRLPEARYYQALCLAKLGQKDAAVKAFDELVQAGKDHLAQASQPEPADFFAKFGERETGNARAATTHFTIGLGLLGKGQAQPAKREFEQAVTLNASHVWARFQSSAVH